MDRLYGRNAVREALRAQRRRIQRVLLATDIHDIVTLAQRARVPIDYVDRQRLDHLAGTHHQGVVAETDPFPYTDLEELVGEQPLLLALDTLQDPQNFGTLLRTAQAIGITGVLIPEHRAVGVTPAVSNASAGAVEHLQVARVTNLARSLQQLKTRSNVWVYGLAVQAEQPFWQADLRGPTCIVVGAESTGLSRLVRETCDVLLHIPMAPGAVESLNAAVAGSLVLYEAYRQRRP